MNLRTLARFLLVDRASIVTAASSLWALPLGFLLVLSAALARNYDGVWLPAEPHVLLHGLAASLGTSFLLFTIVYALFRARRPKPSRREPAPFIRAYLSFLGLFWLTAPLAWLYAIPYERFLPPLDAVTANAWTLALVAAWRVLLISRALSVLFRARFLLTLLIVLAFSDIIVFAANTLAPEVSLVSFMGGFVDASLTASEEHALGALNVTAAIGALYALVPLVLAALISLAWWKPQGLIPFEPSITPPSRALVAAFIIISLAFLPALIFAQSEQRRRDAYERLLAADQLDAAVALLSRHSRSDFPPMWNPFMARGEPRRPTHALTHHRLNALIESAGQPGAAPWIRPFFVQEAWRRLIDDEPFRRFIDRPDRDHLLNTIPDDERAPLAAFLVVYAAEAPDLADHRRKTLRDAADALAASRSDFAP